MPYCLYLRKSRADMEVEAHGEGETLARHEKILLEVAKRLNYDVTQIYREIVSGETIAARPVMQRLLSEVEQGLWNGVLVVEVERLARGDTMDQGLVAQAFRLSGTKIITPLKIYDPDNEMDEEYFEFGLFMSRREYKAINRRLQRGREAAVKEGKYIGPYAPYGYKRVRIENGKGWTLEVIPEQAEVVRLIFRLYADGEQRPDGSVRNIGAGGICRVLENSHVLSPSGDRQWWPHTVTAMLQNPTYVGKVRWGHNRTKRKIENGVVSKTCKPAPKEEWILTDGIHEAIVSEDLFTRVAEKLSSHGPAPVHAEKHIRNPFAGIIVCGKCGRAMTYAENRNCPRLYCRNQLCDNPETTFDVFESRVLDGLSEWLEGYRLKWRENLSQTDNSVKQSRFSLNKLERELSALKKQLTRTYELLERDVYTVETFLARSQAIAAQIKDTEEKIADGKSSLSIALENEESKRTLIPKIEKLLDVYRTLPDAAAKNAMLKEVLVRVEYRRGELQPGKRDKNDFEITLYPKLPATEI